MAPAWPAAPDASTLSREKTYAPPVDDLARVLALTAAELEADDARLELGGREPPADVVWCPVGDGPYRLVLVYDEGPPQPVEQLRDRLRLLVGSFASTLSAVRTPPAALDPQRSLVDTRLRTLSAIAALRAHSAQQPGSSRLSLREGDYALLSRRFGGIYWLLLVFDAVDFSELHAEAAMIHAAPWIERLVTALPPVDPDGKGGRVVKLRRLRKL